MTPYAGPTDRVRALYRIPSTTTRNRTLEIRHGRESILGGGPSPADSEHVSCDLASGLTQSGYGLDHGAAGHEVDAALPFQSATFDVVVLHRTLDDLAEAVPNRPTFDAQTLLRALSRVLIPGGLVAGCIGNRASMPGMAHRLRRAVGLGSSGDMAFHHSPKSLRRMLDRAAFTDIRIFTLLPNFDAPLRLVELDATVSRIAFRRELDARRRHLSSFAFGVRRVAVESGLSRHLEPSLFFWASKPC